MKNLPSKSLQTITDVDQLTELGPDLPTDTQSTIRLGFIAIALGFGSFLAWAAWAPLDEGVPAPAIVAIDTKRKAIQHMTGGIVDRVLVREGQFVKAGDVLVELNEGSTRANFESIRQSYMAQRAAESRLLAELSNASVISFHPDLLAASNDAFIKQHITTQTQLFESRRNSVRNEIGAMDESIAGQVAMLAGNLQQIESRKLQAEKQAEQLKSVSDLANEGYVPRNQALQLEQGQAELNATLADLQASRIRIERSIAEMRLRKAQRTQDFLKEAGTQLADVRKEVQAGRERLDAVAGELGRVKIKSPVDGQVVGITLSSVGGIVSPGQRLMDVVPKEEGVILEAKLPVIVIDRVRAGDEVAVRFSTFAHSPQLVVDGLLNSISGDVVTESTAAGNTSYYLARIQLTKEGLNKLGNHTLQPGMSAEVLIKTGERSLLTYLMNPLSKRVAASMKEE